MEVTNSTFDELAVGDGIEVSRLVTARDVELFAVVSGDHNPLHLDPEYAATTQFGECIGHGMLIGAFVSAVIGLEFPGPGTVYLGQNLEFRSPIFLGDTLTIALTVDSKHPKKPWVTLSLSVKNQEGREVCRGESRVIAPTQKQTVKVIPPPAVELLDHDSPRLAAPAN
ncbi:MaoC/PaaZ C-terminal domain-containing protein [Luminiphilus sp.]|jgi:acyl dehydratase|nr:MaoC family dehydratase N-terminal domain-containing protein [Luminiphilus sp.]MDA7582007.1 MaoC/PaaZ C-terminal domain-containing protein [Luminiphilus sp.]MDA8797088.1 MaoC/PaaZ C-terminal domain-containing protein [Luminiphilus sp.]MDA8946064.1 MaoC/PaaZ C-terminal domain-containing protein [Luminiphilus sp.]MDB2316817.1 MaoC/PaaZ C-terminal domain-containing protein [Luminiphilus sp.]